MTTVTDHFSIVASQNCKFSIFIFQVMLVTAEYANEILNCGFFLKTNVVCYIVVHCSIDTIKNGEEN